MPISLESSGYSDHLIDTPDGSLFVPSPTCLDGVFSADVNGALSRKLCMQEDVDWHEFELPVEMHSVKLRELAGDKSQAYSGIILKDYRVHPGRFGSSDDSSLLEVVIQSGFDEDKCMRIVADGSESVHSFACALGEEFLNSSDSVQLKQVSVLSTSSSSGYVCVVEAIYPALPRFKHLAQTFVGIARSDRSVMEASLSATCNVFGQILQTFQAEGFIVPPLPVEEEVSSPKRPIGFLRKLFVCR